MPLIIPVIAVNVAALQLRSPPAVEAKGMKKKQPSYRNENYIFLFKNIF